MKLIADSGSTKTTWCLISDKRPNENERYVTGVGINPVRDDEAAINSALDGVDLLSSSEINEVHFYGAGCIPTTIPIMERVLSKRFPDASIEVASDLLGAARALCGKEEGIACILGTGSNSGLYDGCQLVANVSPMGWILGDEGSGAVLGRTLVSELYKGSLQHLRQEFEEEYLPTLITIETTPQAAIIQAVYRSPMPNRFLASLVPFLAQKRKDHGIEELIEDAFRKFFRRNVAAYGRPDLPVNFVGGVAGAFETELRAAAVSEGFDFGHIMTAPIKGIVRYHD